MLNAIHKKTGKLVSVFKLTRDTSWIGTEKDEWITPKSENLDWNRLLNEGINEVKVSYIKTHTREYDGKKRIVIPHFRIQSDDIIRKYCLPESKEHELAKNGIYDEIYNDTLLVKGKPLSILGEIDDIIIEDKLSKSQKSKIADVSLTFKNQHPLYGKGIVFEIQFSYQNKDTTEERTYDRILEGYSVVWLWDKCFRNNNLINKEIEVIPFLKAIEEYKELKEEELNSKIKRNSFLIDKKIDDSNKIFNDLYNDFLSKLQKKVTEFDSYSHETLTDFKTQSHEQQSTTLNKINTEINEIIKKEISSIDIDYDILKEDMISYFSNDAIKNMIMDKIFSNLEGSIKERISNIKEEEIIKTIKERIKEEEKKYISIDGFIAINCKTCGKSYPVHAMQFEKTNCYCQICFDNLPDNWMKREGRKPITKKLF